MFIFQHFEFKFKNRIGKINFFLAIEQVADSDTLRQYNRQRNQWKMIISQSADLIKENKNVCQKNVIVIRITKAWKSALNSEFQM